MIHKIRYSLQWNRAARLNKRGEGLIEVECRQQGRRIYFSTHIYCKPDEWCNGSITGIANAEPLNYVLYLTVQDIERIELEYIKRGVNVTLPMLREAVRSKVSPAAKLRDFGLEVVSQSDRREQTKQNCHTLLNDLDRFRIQQMVSRKGFLTEKQLHALERLSLTGKDETARDAFLLACYTGLRFSDIVTLRQDHISADGWLTKEIVKTGFTVEIPTGELFNGKATELIAKYDGDVGNLTRMVPCNAGTNRRLKDMFLRVGADTKLTFHCSRHTFATLLGRRGADITTIQKLLGHQKATTTEIYRETDRSNITAGLSRMRNKFHHKY